MATKIVGVELNVTNNKLFRVGVQGRLVHCNTAVAQIAQERRFPSIIQTKEKQAGIFVVQACEREKKWKQC